MEDVAFRWIDDWAKLPDEPSARRGWMHTGVVVTAANDVVVGHPGEPILLVFDSGGQLSQRVPVPEVVEIHGLTLVEEAGEELLWVADNATKFRVEGPDVVPLRPHDGSAILIDLEGRIRKQLLRPERPEYENARYSPTSVVVDERRFGGSGDVWVADGYGASLVHRFDSDGRHLLTLTGESGAGRFDCPHGMLIDRRGDEPKLYVTDRGNSRIQVYDLSGKFMRAFGTDFLIAPTVLTANHHEVIVTDFLGARLTFLERDDQLLEHLYANPDAPRRGTSPDAWPNARDAEGNIVRPRLMPEVLNSPHAVAADDAGSLYVTEWLLGGRVTKLERV